MANKPFAIQGADLTLGGVKITLNDNGSVTFPDGSVQTTAYKGGNLNTWVQTFETSLRVADIPTVASSVEYLANGDIVALFVNLKDINLGFASYNTYSGVARFDTIGRLVWSMNFQGNGEFEQFTDGWGLAVDNVNGYIYVAGRVAALFGGNTATLTKLSQATGGVEWSKTYDVGFNNSNTVVDVASDGSPIVVGFATSTASANQVITTRIDASTGAVTWSRALGGQGDEEAYGMAVGPNNEVVAVGYMENIEYPGPTYTILTLTANPASDPGWVNNLTGVVSGDLTFDVSFTAGVATFSNIVDTSGDHYAGEAIGVITSATLGPGSTNLQFIVGTTTTEDLSDHMLVVKYTSTGTISWQKSVAVEADYDCAGADADIDSMGNIYVCGNFEQDGDSAMIIFKFDSAGVKQWSRKVEGNCGNFATSIVVGPDDYLYLSAVTDAGTFPNHDYKMVIAKYDLDGIVVWQRLLENTTTQTFNGAWWFTNSGGSNMAVRDGYVAVAGSFGEFDGPGDVTTALVAQFNTAGTEFEIGDYAFVAATFSGTLDSSASNITVAGAAKADSNYAGEFTVADFTPAVDLTGDLIGILYYGDGGSDDRLTNGTNNLVLTPAGAVTLPRGGTISEGYVTSNPTIQLMPARPDVASQKLVIKGGGSPTSYTRNNGLQLSWSNTTTNVGDIINFTVNSDTVNQTLYWWIYPENVGLGDPNYGTVAIDEFGSGYFNFDIASEAYEFTVRVSPIDGQYDPDNVGVESYLINGNQPTYLDHHLHLTTGNLAETSIFLGTDDHNVRTTTTGSIQITTPNIDSSGTSQVWNFGPDGVLRLPNAMTIDGSGTGGEDVRIGGTSTWISVNNNGAPPGFYVRTDAGVGNYQWLFGPDGSTTLPIGVSIDESNGSHFPRIVADTGKAFSVQGQGSTGSVALQWIETESTSSQIAQVGLNKFGGSAAVTLTAGTSTNDMKLWRFDSTGTTTFPQGSTIGETTTTTIISPPGASAGQSFVIRPTGAINTESSHIHLVSGNPTTVDLYLGDDNQYVKIEKNGGNVVIGTDNNNNHWTFGTLGDLTLPYDGGITFSDSSTQSTAWLGGGSSSLATTASSSNDFNFGNFINTASLDITYTAFTGDSGIDFDISYQVPLDGTKGVTVGAIETPLIISTGTVILKTDINSSTSTWTFGTDGILTVPGSIIPDTDVAYDLGSPTAKFRSLYLSTSTIYIGTSTISVSQTGQMLVNGNDAVSKLEYFGGEGIGPRDAGSIGWNTSTFTFNLPGKELLTAIYDLKPGNKIRGVNTQLPQFGGFDREFTIVGNAREYIRSGGYQMAAIDIAETTSTERYVYALYLPVKDKSATLSNGTSTLTVSTTGTVVFPNGTIQTGAAISRVELKTLVAASTDFADFKSRIAAL